MNRSATALKVFRRSGPVSRWRPLASSSIDSASRTRPARASRGLDASPSAQARCSRGRCGFRHKVMNQRLTLGLRSSEVAP